MINILEQNMFLCTASVMIFYICDQCEIMVWGHEVHNSIDKHKHMAYKTWLNTNGKRVAMLFGLGNRWKPSPSLWTGDWFVAYIKPELLKKRCDVLSFRENKIHTGIIISSFSGILAWTDSKKLPEIICNLIYYVNRQVSPDTKGSNSKINATYFTV